MPHEAVSDRENIRPRTQIAQQYPTAITLHARFLREMMQRQPAGRSIERQLPLDVHLHLAAVLFKFPRIDAAVGPQAKIDAGMRGQVLRVFRPRPLGEIGGRVDDRRAHVRSDAHRDHIFGNLLTVLRPR